MTPTETPELARDAMASFAAPNVRRPDWELRLRHAIAHPKMPKQIGEDLIGCLSEIDRLRAEMRQIADLLIKSHETGWMKYSTEALQILQSANNRLCDTGNKE